MPVGANLAEPSLGWREPRWGQSCSHCPWEHGVNSPPYDAQIVFGVILAWEGKKVLVNMQTIQ